ncbi:MAG: hypothetical protein KAV00_16505 [Phycisphaerae bacterium]|nr:hypothetical protein [Phycisphaerae bacterium]
MCHAKMLLTTLLLVIIGLAITGCGTSSAFPFDYNTVWNAAVGEAIVWRPDIINDDARPYYVCCTRADLFGTEVKYDLKVTNDLNIFARRPSTRVHVSIRQTKPTRIRFTQMEKEFLAKVAERLIIAPPPE